jgi:nitrate reductase NapD
MLMKKQHPSRRSILAGRVAPDRDASLHISSAVVSVLPDRRDDVLRLLSELPEVEIHQQSDSKIVIVLEGPDSGALGGRLAEISSWRGVLSANMVYEHVESLADLGDRT